MFNLDNAITEWRRRMVMAGIKSPTLLDELESHLRDDVEQRMEAGLSAEQAFEEAVRRIGQAEILGSEFGKVDGMAERNQMNDTVFASCRRSFATGLLAGIAVVFALMLYGVLRHPASVSGGGLPYFLVLVAGLPTYAGLALWARSRSTGVTRFALGRGAGIGLLLGAASVANISFENFASFQTPVRAALGISMWGLMFVAFGIAGSATYNQTGSFFHAICSSVWSALVSVVVTLVYGFSTSLLFMPHMQRILEGDFAQSGMTDSRAFVVQNTLNAASSHLLLVPCIAVLFGFAGGFGCMLLRPVRRSIAVSLGVFELLLVGLGLASIHFASSLNRADRGPFIMGGLLALGIALSCAHPVCAAMRRKATD